MITNATESIDILSFYWTLLGPEKEPSAIQVTIIIIINVWETKIIYPTKFTKFLLKKSYIIKGSLV